MHDKIGVGIITHKRPEFLKLCLGSLPGLSTGEIDTCVLVDDSGNFEDSNESEKIFSRLDKHGLTNFRFIAHEVNRGVAKAKNTALKALFDAGCTYLFLLEDDIIIKSPDIFMRYIEASKISGIQHFNYGPGSPFNRKQDSNIRIDLDTRHLLKQDSQPNPKLIVEYSKEVKIALYEHTVAMLSFFNRAVIESVGYMDEQFKNAWDHVDYTYRIYKAGFTTSFWWFADVYESEKLLDVAPGAIDNSSIATKKEEWMKDVMHLREVYKQKHGFYPNHTPQHTQVEVLKSLREIYNKKYK